MKPLRFYVQAVYLYVIAMCILSGVIALGVSRGSSEAVRLESPTPYVFIGFLGVFVGFALDMIVKRLKELEKRLDHLESRKREDEKSNNFPL